MGNRFFKRSEEEDGRPATARLPIGEVGYGQGPLHKGRLRALPLAARRSQGWLVVRRQPQGVASLWRGHRGNARQQRGCKGRLPVARPQGQHPPTTSP
ncbi:hypothetical protein BHM03_00048982 [Ensete ventricosum]|nr:hypothetical protein BHM03_00048982 [Ensete ventricosum]